MSKEKKRGPGAFELDFDGGGPPDPAYEEKKVPAAELEENKLEEVHFPPSGNRPETGAMQFGEDWPGTFIRGDDSFLFKVQLATLLEYVEIGTLPDGLTVQYLKGLMDILASSEAGSSEPAKLKPYTSCKK